MESINHSARQDRAITDAESDALERSSFVSSLMKTLVHTDFDAEGNVAARKSTGLVIGLTGEWGLGKSSVLNMLSVELKKMDNVVVATLNPWLFKGRDELIQAYFNSLREALGQSAGEKVRAVQGQLERYKTSIEVTGSTAAALVDLYVTGGVATAFWKKWIAKGFGALIKPNDLSATQERETLEVKLAEANVVVVVLIDELDRVEDDEVRAVAQLVKAVGDIKGISYLVAYDTDRVAQALGTGDSIEDRQRSGESYLEKIIQFSIPLRPLFDTDARAFLQTSLRNNGVELPEAAQDYQAEIFEQLLGVIRTPREIKRLIGAFSVFEEMLRGEICPYDLLGYCWLIAKSPGVRQLIANNVQGLVDDPDIEELSDRMHSQAKDAKPDERLQKLLGTSAMVHVGILRLLFPRFKTDVLQSAGIFEGGRISKRRNLVRLLYLGNPPGTLSRAEIEVLWSTESSDALANELMRLITDGKIDSLFDRIGDLLPTLSRSGDHKFWVAMSRALTRPHDWITGHESTGRLVDDASTILWGFARSIPSGRGHVRGILEALIRNGDLLITPWILRKHLFAHELTGYARQSNGDEIFTLRETMDLQSSEIPRYRAAVIDGTVLRRLPDTEAIYCIINSKKWDQKLRSSLTAQLNDWDSISTFTALILPPNVSTSRKNLDEMIDADAVLVVIDKLLEDRQLPVGDWLAPSLDLLREILGDRDGQSDEPSNQDPDRSLDD